MARTDYFKFLDALAANNDRAWFQAHRAEYEAVRDQWLDDLQKLRDTSKNLCEKNSMNG